MAKPAVGLVVLTRVCGQVVAVLQKRGSAGIERIGSDKTLGQSYAGGCQVTAHGPLEEGEDYEIALIREAREELGQEFSEALVLVQSGAINEDDVVRTYLIFLSNSSLLKLIRLGPDTGGLVLVSREGDPGNNIYPLSDVREFTEADKGGVEGVSDIAMFPDELAAVRKAFEVWESTGAF